ncbi:hypothetical protein D9Q98_004825 [Chlorella vulgaris]|uniref:RBR-type E3 ubiquitin transferase n=1 Tax=Chlorella vulgaris TaxID=3077 RepID=A0A9D4YWL7_CHLVU|nr:hypothetical protein D9Q98_004825 [Chlorella vulgaris]
MAMAAGLSDDMLLNWQQQVDEVQALEAIFASSFQLVEAAGVPCGSSDAGAQCSRLGTSASAFDDGAQLEVGKRSEALDAASLQHIDAPCSSQWELHCSLMAPVEPPAGSLRLLLQDRHKQQQQQQQDQQGKQQAEHTDRAEQDAAGRLTDSGSSSSRAEEHAGASGGYTVQHLPPICLQLRMTAGYPSEQPPGVRLSAAWLSAAQASALESQLLQQWQDQGPGAPICYSWADWLQTHALMHLGVDQWLLLADDCRPDSGSDVGGCNGSGGTLAAQQQQEQELDGGSAEQRLGALLRYNAVQDHAAFQQATHTCGVCLEQQPGRCFVRLDGCRHAWCRGCLGEQARIHVAEGGLEHLRCSHPQCAAALDPSVLRRVLCPEDFARWEQLTLQRTLDAMPDASYCPRCGTVSLEDSDSCAQCSKCLFVFCSLCNEGWHPGTTCVSADTKLAMLRHKMAGGSRAAVEGLRRQEQDLLSLAQIEKTAKRCPRCGTATQKAEGCNKMSCGGCGAYWCWRCNKEIDGYRHFRSGECVLFDEAEILRWEDQWADMQAAHRVMAAGMRNEFVGETAARAGGRPRGCFCPQCGQVNHKMGNNNLIACWSCTSRFCYCCRTVLRGRGAGGTHFGPRGCKQHSPD